MPPLRARVEDVPQLLSELIANMEADKRGSVRFNSSAVQILQQYGWPGNVRELANLVERMAILFPHGIVGANNLPEKILMEQDFDEPSGSGVAASARESKESVIDQSIASELLSLEGLDLKEYLTNLEKGLIAQALQDSGGVVAHAADRLQLRRTTLVEKIRKYNLHKTESEQDSKVSAEDSKKIASG